MTPTPTLLLFVALFWTLPATAAVLTYRRHDSSIENATASVQRIVESALGRAGLQPRADA